MRDPQAKSSTTDYALLIMVLALTFIGIPLVYDTSFPHGLNSGQSPFKSAEMQLFWVVAGLAGMACAMMTPFWKLRHYAPWILGICGVALLMVFIPHLGMRENGAFRWIGHGSVRLQPSEFAKAALILFLAGQCATKPNRRNDWTKWTSPAVLCVVLLGGVIAVEPDLGTATVVFGTGFGILYFAGLPKRKIIGIISGLLIFGLFLTAAKSFVHHAGRAQNTSTSTTSASSGIFQLDRINVWLHPDENCKDIGYQVCMSRMAIGSGGLLGAGFGEGRQKYNLPEADSDFIFSTVAEELGLIGSLAVISLYALIVFRGINIASTTTDPYGSLVAAGISIMIGLQALINVATVTSMIPATGLPLPFISYGGSSICVCLALAGVLLNISRHPKGDTSRTDQKKEMVYERDFNRRWDRPYRPSGPDRLKGVNPGLASASSKNLRSASNR
jgi:cell division protein FtsW